MSKKTKILIFAGSLRKESLNKKNAKNAAEIAKGYDVVVTYIDLENYPIPLYNGDEEEKSGLPENARKLKGLFIEHDAFIISSPEYNSGISGVLKNYIDWISRPEDSDPEYLAAFKGKVIALMSASPGNLGGLRGLVQVRYILNNIYMLVIPDQVTVSNAHEAFDENGNFKNEIQQKKVEKLVKTLIETTQKLQK